MNKDDCVGCNNSKTCFKPCLYLDIIRKLTGMKNKGRMESLAPPDTTDDRAHREDYKEIILDQQKNKLLAINTTIKEIRNLGDINLRAVAAMLYAGLTIQEISFIMDKSERTIKRLCGKP